MEINDNQFLRQFEAKINGNLAIIEYSLQERKIFLTKIKFKDIDNNLDSLNAFIEKVLDNLIERNIRVVPTAAIITKFIRKNRRYKSLLPVGIRI